MTLEQLMELTNRYRLYVLRLSAEFIEHRKYGVRECAALANTTHLLDLKLLEKIANGNERRLLTQIVRLPVWMDAITFDTMITQIQKRLS